MQRQAGSESPLTPLLNFSGSTADDDEVADLGAVSPSDANVDVGAGHVVQTVNSVLQVWSTSGDPELGPIATTDIFAEIGGQCGGGGFNAVDTVVRYDELAGRWVIAFVPYDFAFVAPFNVCVAVSTSSDPTESWNAYAYDFGVFPVNPRMGVWPDGYYLAFDELDENTLDFAGSGTVAFDRAAMIDGAESPAVVGFDLGEEFPNLSSMVPSDLDGAAIEVAHGIGASNPPPGAPNHQAAPGHPNWDGSPGPVLHMFEFHADFETPANSTLTGPFDVTVPDFNPSLCDGAFSCIPELGGVPLNPTAGALMQGMQYRNLGDHEAMVVSQTVNAAESGDLAAVRWYEIRLASPGAVGGVPPFSLFQSGTYSPSETNRFVPSIAMDANGNIAMGYSISDASINPQIGYTGRLTGDPLGTMGSEAILIAGTGSQDAPYWGNYTGMAVDPDDGCTFWYTNQYLETDGGFNWSTRLGSFKFPSCVAGPSGSLHGTVTDGTDPIAGATVKAGAAGTATNASGEYVLTLPVGTYTVTASKYGFLPSSASGVEITDGGDASQDFTLTTAPTTLVNGTVKDGSGGGWPLAANITITAPGAPTFHVTTDPVTGYYGVTLAEGITYDFAIAAATPGYQPGGGPLDLGSTLAASVVKNWELLVNVEVCSAPGYSVNVAGLQESFDAGELPGGWLVTNDSEDGGGQWFIHEGGDPCGHSGTFSGNLTGGTGPYALVDSDCDGLVSDDTSLITSSVDMSSFSSARVRFNTDYVNLGDTADVDISTNGGTSWTNVWERTSSLPGPSVQSVDITGLAAGQSDVKARFHYYDAFFAWWWQVDNVVLGQVTCEVGTGGLVSGIVKSQATNAGLNGATVENVPGGAKTTTYSAPGYGDGFYALFAEAGPNEFQASLDKYQTAAGNEVVVPGATQRLDFSLNSGSVSFAPLALNGRVNPGGTQTQPATVTNTGTAPASFKFIEINAPLLVSNTHGFASETQRQQALARLPRSARGEPEHTALTARGLARLTDLPRGLDRVLAAGDVLSSFDSGLSIGWGVATHGTDVWLSNPSYLGGGDNNDHRFLAGGTDTGDVISEDGVGLWAGDGAYNSNTGKFWRLAVGNDNCLYEFDPATLSQTGNTVCGPWTAISQRGVAYDPATDTFYVGGWNELIVYHIDNEGNILDSADVGLPISGLAYSPANGHLLAMSNQPAGQDVTVLNALDNYAVLGSFQVVDNGSPVFGDFEQAGMEFDCLGNLWVINQTTQVVYQVDAGEAAQCEVDIPWFSIDPKEGTLGAAVAQGGSSSQPVTASWNPGSLTPGLYQAQVAVKTDTPASVPSIPVSLTVRFNDVADSNQFEAYIYGAAGAGVMFGGPPVCPGGILSFCPDGVVTRADMAGYVWRAINGRNAAPPVYQNVFTDVTFNDYNAFYIQGIHDLGITAGCGTNIYCPNNVNTRAQMSVFIVKATEGSDFVPPACTPPGTFTDVACPGGFAVDYIEYLYNLGVTAGCGGTNFCPNANITNGQMSVFLVKAFGIPHL